MAKPKTPTSDTAPSETQDLPQDQTPPPETPDLIAPEAEPVVTPEPDARPEAEPSPEPSAPEAPPATRPAPARRGVFLPLMLGGVVAAGLGAGAAIYALPHLPAALQALLPQPQDRPEITALETALAEQTARTQALTADLDALKSMQPPAPDLSGVQAALDQANAQTSQMSQALADLTARLDVLERRPAADGGVPAAALEAFQRDLDQMRATLESQNSAGSVTQDQIAAAADAAQARIAEAEAQAATLRDQAQAAAQRTMAQAAVARLGAALDGGVPLAPALADLQAAGVALPEDLQADLPALADLQAAFPDAARAALSAARKETAGEALSDRMGAFLMAQLGARSLEPQEGTDPDAVLSRAQAAVDRADLAGALTEIAALPASAQAALAEWSAQAQRRVAASDALAALAQAVK